MTIFGNFPKAEKPFDPEMGTMIFKLMRYWESPEGIVPDILMEIAGGNLTKMLVLQDHLVEALREYYQKYDTTAKSLSKT